MKPHKAEGHHFCVPTGDEYSRCCKCGGQRGYRPILDGSCVIEVNCPNGCGLLVRSYEQHGLCPKCNYNSDSAFAPEADKEGT